MKKVAKGFAVALVLVCLAFSMTGCAGAGKYVLSAGVGEYKVETTVHLKTGGKFEITVESNGEKKTTAKGTWKKKGDTITLTSEDGNAVKGTLKGKELTFAGLKYTKK